MEINHSAIGIAGITPKTKTVIKSHSSAKDRDTTINTNRRVRSPDSIQEYSLSFEFPGKEDSETDILQLPERMARKKNIRQGVCIDEFKQGGEFQDSITFQKKLRSVWQHQQNVSYCLFGSKRHLMTEIFSDGSNPFYKFGDMMFP